MSTRLLQALIVAAVAVGVYLLVGWARNETEPVATVPGALVGRADTAASAAGLRGAAAAIELYRIDHGTYAGATTAALVQYDRSVDPTVRLVRADDAGYCLETGTGTAVSSLRGPGGAVASGSC